ncbi:MAG: hypothetical protein KHZ62_01155 [Clostridiales bacterium]|nr:hypothetical protein [Clostridiales bacterium]
MTINGVKLSVAILSSIVIPNLSAYAYDTMDYTGKIQVEGRGYVNYSSARMVDDEVYIPLDELGIYTEKEGVWDQSSNIVKIRYKNIPIGNSSELEGNRFPLLAAVPEKNIYLYGLQPQGMVLYQQDQAIYIGGDYLSPRFFLPTIFAEDFDGDKREDTAVILTADIDGLVETLFVVPTDQAQKILYNFTMDSYLTQLKDHVTLGYGQKNGEISLYIDQKRYRLNLEENIESDPLEICLGDSVHFYAEGNQLKGEFTVSVTANRQAQFIGILTADIDFDKSKGFLLNNIQLLQNEVIVAGLKQRAEYVIETDLNVQSFFNGAIIDSAVTESPYDPYFPVPKREFQTQEEIENTINDIYASQTRKNHFLNFLNSVPPYYKEINGKLYGNKNQGGKGMALAIKDVRIGAINGNRGVILCDYEIFLDGFVPGTLEVPIAYKEGVWKLEESVYEVWENME